jgi:hypothetical protein
MTVSQLLFNFVGSFSAVVLIYTKAYFTLGHKVILCSRTDPQQSLRHSGQ